MKKENTIQYNSESATILLPHNRYVDKVLSKYCYEELQWLFNDAESPSKEISESYAAFAKLKQHTFIKNNLWLHIGDGSRARTAALFTFMTKSYNVSIDPNMRIDILDKWLRKYNVQNLHCIKVKHQDIGIDTIWYKLSIPYRLEYSIVLVHAHVNVHDIDKQYPDWQYMYSSICCYKGGDINSINKKYSQTFNEQYMKDNNIIVIDEGIDLGILSERREYIIYKKLNIQK